MTQKVQFIIEAIDEASAKLNQVTKGLDGMGAQSKISKTDIALAGAAISGSIFKIGSDAVNVFKGFEKTMSGVNAVLEPTKEDFEALSKLARDLGKSTAYSAQESAEMIEMLAKNGITATQIMEGAAQASLNLAAATGSNLTNASDIASSSMIVFGKTVKDLDQVVNSITGTTNVSKFSIDDYGLALAQGGGAAAAAGVSMEDFNTSIAAISPLFASGSDAGTSFKTFLARLIPSTDKAYEAMQSLGIITKEGSNQFLDAQGNLLSMADISGVLQKALTGLSDEQRISAMNTIFGTDALRAASGMAKIGTAEFEKMSKAIEGTDAAKNAATRLDNLAGSIEGLGGAAQELQLTLGSMLEPAVRAVVDGLRVMANVVSEAIGWINQLPAPIAGAIQLFAGLVIGGVALTAMWAAMSVTMGGVALAMWAIIAPAAPIIAAVAAIAAALYLLYEGGKVVAEFFSVAWENNLGGMRDFTIQVWTDVKNIFETAMDFIRMVIGRDLEILSFLWTNKTAILSAVWNGFWNGVMSVLETAIQVVTLTATAFYSLFTGDFEGFINGISLAWTTAWTFMRDSVLIIWNAISTQGHLIWESFGGYFTKLIAGLTATVSGLWDKFTDGLKSVWTSITGWFLGEGGSAFSKAFSSMFGTVVSAAKNIFNVAIQMIEDFVNTAIRAINQLIRASNKVNPFGSMAEVPPLNIPRFAHGGLVKGPGGLDRVPAMLTAGEVVLNAAQQSNVARSIEQSNRPGGINVYITGNSFFGDDESFASKIGDKILEDLKMHTAIQSF